jgi:hypothetical protein
MKWNLTVMGWCLGGLALVMPVRGAETNAVAGRVGVYDSRVVAWAWFSSAAHMAQLQAQVAAARAEKQAGDTNKLQVDSAALRALQDQMHREVFSTAPCEEALTEIKGRIPEIERAAGVGELVSKWDGPALKQHPGAEQVDMTDRLVQAFFQPTEKQSEMIESIKKSEPLPLEKCNELIRAGKI